MSLTLGEFRFSLNLSNENQWKEVIFELPSYVFEPDVETGLAPNMVMLYFGLEAPDSGASVFYIDDVQFLEWRNANELPDIFSGYHAARLHPDVENALVVQLERIVK